MKNQIRRLLFLTFLVITSFSLGLTLTGCTPNEDTKINADSEALSLVREAESLQEGVRLGQRLNSLSTNDRDSVTTLLNDLKLGLLRVAENPNDIDALRMLKRSLIEWQKYSVQLHRTDETIFTEFTGRVYALLYTNSQQVGLAVDDLSWALFTTDFSVSPEPFQSVSNKTMWETAWAQDEPYIGVSGNDTKAWLLSPTYDLSQIRDPGFRIEHLYMINRNTGQYATDIFDRTRIVNEVFTVRVSTNYVSGDPDAKDSNGKPMATWEQVDISPLPTAYNFHEVKSPIVSLEKFKGEKVTIAFVYDNDSTKFGHHYVTWQIGRFELFGAGEMPTSLPRKQGLWAHQFRSQDLKPFQAANFGDANASTWAPFAPGSSVKFAKIQGTTDAKTEAWLLSPRISLSGTELSLMILETVAAPTWDKFNIMVSTNYENGDPRQAQWDILPRENTPEIPAGKWTDFQTSFDLSVYAGKTIVLAFKYIEPGMSYLPAWEINSMTISGFADPAALGKLEVDERDYKLIGTKPEGNGPGTTPGTPAPVFAGIKALNFNAVSLAPFVSFTAAGGTGAWAPFAVKGEFKYAKAGSGATPIDTWLVSPRMTVTGTELKMILKHTVKNPAWADWKMKISYDYNGGPIGTATWSEISIEPAVPVTPEKWTDLVFEYDLNAASGKAFVIAFQYKDPGGPGARVWEIEALQFLGKGTYSASQPLTVE